MNKPGSLMRPMAKALACVALLTTLSGCVGLVAGGAVMTAVSANDRRTLGAQTEDKAIALKGESRARSIVGEQGHVNVTSFNRKVLLTGEVRDEGMKAAVEREVRAVGGVMSLVNELEIGSPSKYTTRSNDALITTKVKASLVDMQTISANSFKVVTERGNVYLMGIVTPREAQIGTDVARGVSGVQKVVKVFEYINDVDLKALPPVSNATGS
ncbi:BON domain-containing protein [Massilia sp. GCM10020059]|uniref:BON domain-containing protein n=1 Tax=Massilia agrisoli TaxID=2892444 RepID=A0ABS8IP69_9BURK|nr:BON domain-containing protein [Massilia agrisoli]MCC6070400.1 BON domain-containing protein [Massilia agrisoli]